MDDNRRNKGRSAIYGMAGCYLLYLAYQIFQNREESVGTEYVLTLAGAVAFLLIGLGIIGFSLYMMYKIKKEEESET